MEPHEQWWFDLPQHKKTQLAYDEHWTTVDSITDHQIKMLYDASDY
jgi:hypothetical protein